MWCVLVLLVGQTGVIGAASCPGLAVVPWEKQMWYRMCSSPSVMSLMCVLLRHLLLHSPGGMRRGVKWLVVQPCCTISQRQ